MKFVISRASSDSVFEVKDFTTIEEIINFMNENNNPLIIQKSSWYQEEDIENMEKWYPNVNVKELVTIPYELEIYDDYIE